MCLCFCFMLCTFYRGNITVSAGRITLCLCSNQWKSCNFDAQGTDVLTFCHIGKLLD